MHHKTTSDVFQVIARVTGKLPCVNCGRLGIDPQVRAAAAAA